MNDFERKLKAQSFRQPPQEWRDEILDVCDQAEGRRNAQASLVEADSAPAWSWREWLWPSPAAWGALAAVWVVCFSMNAATKPPATPPLHVAAPSAAQNAEIPLFAFQLGRDFDVLLTPNL